MHVQIFSHSKTRIDLCSCRRSNHTVLPNEFSAALLKRIRFAARMSKAEPTRVLVSCRLLMEAAPAVCTARMPSMLHLPGPALRSQRIAQLCQNLGRRTSTGVWPLAQLLDASA